MLELENITKIYKAGQTEVHALRGISCRIESGEMVSIVGPSGSGKSTLMNIIGCLDKPTSGRYYLDGTEVSELNDNQLAEIRSKKIGFVFQSFNLLSPGVGRPGSSGQSQAERAGWRGAAKGGNRACVSEQSLAYFGR